MEYEGMNAPREIGMQRSLEFQERAQPRWSDVAAAFLDRYARTHKTFTSEAVTAASVEFGLVTVQPKAWGSLYVSAARAGHIKRIGYGQNTRRHMSPTPIWESQIYGRPA